MATKIQDPAKDARAFGVIGNIPADYHSADLRNYFSMFIEDGGFTCFHFRHRPELRIPEKERESPSSAQTSSGAALHQQAQAGLSQSDQQHVEAPSSVRPKSKTTCCVVKLTVNKLDELIQRYHRTHWLDSNGDCMSQLCLISPVKVSGGDAGPTSQPGGTRLGAAGGKGHIL